MKSFLIFITIGSFLMGTSSFLLAVMADTTILAITQTVQTLGLAAISAWGGYMLASIKKTSSQGHDLANSFMLEQKRKYVVSRQEILDLTTDPIKQAIAQAKLDEANDAYTAHKEIDDKMRALESGKVTV